MHFITFYGEHHNTHTEPLKIVRFFTTIPINLKYGKNDKHLYKINGKLNYYMNLSLLNMGGEIFSDIKQVYKFISLSDEQISALCTPEILRLIEKVYYYFYSIANDRAEIVHTQEITILYPNEYKSLTYALTSSINFDTIEYTTIQPDVHSIPFHIAVEELKKHGFTIKELFEGCEIYHGKQMITKLNKEYMIYEVENVNICCHILTSFSFTYIDANIYKLLPVENFRLNLIYILQIFKLFVTRSLSISFVDGCSIPCSDIIELKFVNSIPTIFIHDALAFTINSIEELSIFMDSNPIYFN